MRTDFPCYSLVLTKKRSPSTFYERVELFECGFISFFVLLCACRQPAPLAFPLRMEHGLAWGRGRPGLAQCTESARTGNLSMYICARLYLHAVIPVYLADRCRPRTEYFGCARASIHSCSYGPSRRPHPALPHVSTGAVSPEVRTHSSTVSVRLRQKLLLHSAAGIWKDFWPKEQPNVCSGLLLAVLCVLQRRASDREWRRMCRCVPSLHTTIPPMWYSLDSDVHGNKQLLVGD
ncbi:hypothetical protein K438DRAFT_427435 [Mycena galopus ATCC 62051]|nr:hypothetical protein K438DRAFT_427435 [Mycena galopus ATCC 62051]